MREFTSFGTEHMLWLVAGICSSILWVNAGKRIGRLANGEYKQRQLGLLMTLIPAILWIGGSIWLVLYENPIPKNLVLPFHVCYFLNLVMPFMLWRKSFFIFEITYFVTMAGTLQALLTPDLDYGFPDMINIRYFMVHIGLMMSTFYAVFVYGFRPTWKSMGKAILWTNLYMVFVTPINLLFNTNFMYVRAKPPVASMLDYLGDWPWYLLTGQIMLVVLFTIVLLPFLFIRPKEESV